MRTSIIITFFLFMFGIVSFGQTNPNSEYYLPKTFSKTKLWIKADKERAGTNYNGTVVVVGYNGTVPDSMKLSDFLTSIKTQKSFSTFLDSKSWAVKNYSLVFPYLISLLTDTTTVGLTNTADLIIPGRNMKFYGHGGVIEEDIFTVSGRASYILNELTGENFAVVHPTTTMTELKNFQTFWTNWIKKLKH
jgi:hypothetical protein